MHAHHRVIGSLAKGGNRKRTREGKEKRKRHEEKREKSGGGCSWPVENF